MPLEAGHPAAAMQQDGPRICLVSPAHTHASAANRRRNIEVSEDSMTDAPKVIPIENKDAATPDKNIAEKKSETTVAPAPQPAVDKK